MHIIVLVILVIPLFTLFVSSIGAGQVIGRQVLVRELDRRSPHSILAIARACLHRSRARMLAAIVAGDAGLPKGVLRGAHGDSLRGRQEAVHHEAPRAWLGALSGVRSAAEAADAAVHGNGLGAGERVERVGEPLLFLFIFHFAALLPQHRSHRERLVLLHYLGRFRRHRSLVLHHHHLARRGGSPGTSVGDATKRLEIELPEGVVVGTAAAYLLARERPGGSLPRGRRRRRAAGADALGLARALLPGEGHGARVPQGPRVELGLVLRRRRVGQARRTERRAQVDPLVVVAAAPVTHRAIRPHRP